EDSRLLHVQQRLDQGDTAALSAGTHGLEVGLAGPPLTGDARTRPAGLLHGGIPPADHLARSLVRLLRSQRDARPPRGAHEGAVPGQRDVDVVGVGALTDVALPDAVAGVPGTVVPDDRLDAEAARHLPVVVGQPRDGRVADSPVHRVVGVELPVHGPAVVVLRAQVDAGAGQRVTRSLVGLAQQVRDGDDAGLGHRVADDVALE